ncbi:TadE/TadG family type IV pilus assembly protein [Rhodobium gokarnense]|uniref:Flp pilus assembly protein TadG n=1 Tax=Rhodobium gokarnense TaxID=364296 RepID=A0ABT3H870_9HYPH|nr:TadE/TadG family type IV pilus assembly protein [Rhodobium gokarnense]MCW2306511.1 Flp pilus assembly protein TadG [Rhodobium gokarnense]
MRDFATSTGKIIGRMARRVVPRRFLANEDGVYAIEFALVSIWFFPLLFMIFEVAFTIFANQLLDNAVSDTARLIRTGQAQQQSFSKAKFKEEVCGQLTAMFDCDNFLHIDVRTFDNFTSANEASSPVEEVTDEEGETKREIDEGKMAYDQGGARDIVVVRAYYEWPMISPMSSLIFSDLSNGRRLLASVAAFRNEPFPW